MRCTLSACPSAQDGMRPYNFIATDITANLFRFSSV